MLVAATVALLNCAAAGRARARVAAAASARSWNRWACLMWPPRWVVALWLRNAASAPASAGAGRWPQEAGLVRRPGRLAHDQVGAQRLVLDGRVLGVLDGRGQALEREAAELDDARAH